MSSLVTRQQSSPRARGPREQVAVTVSYDLALDLIHHPFCSVLLVTLTSSDSVRGENTQLHGCQDVGLMEGHLGAVDHKQLKRKRENMHHIYMFFIIKVISYL